MRRKKGKENFDVENGKENLGKGKDDLLESLKWLDTEIDSCIMEGNLYWSPNEFSNLWNYWLKNLKGFIKS